MADANELLKTNAFREPMNEAERQRVNAARVPVDRYPSFSGGLIAAVHESSLPPTDAELRLLRAYIEMVVTSRYREPYATRALDSDAPAVSGHNTLIVRKDSDSWRYQRNSWSTPPFPRYDGPVKFDLPALLEHVEDLVPDRWASFAADNAKLISAAADPTRRRGAA